MRPNADRGKAVTKGLRRIRGAFGMGLTWAAGWAFVGGLIELIANIIPGLGWTSLIDIWPATLAIPGFLGGMVFSTVLAVAGRNRRFDQLSLPRFAAWGAVGGVLMSLLPIALVAAGGLTPDATVNVWRFTAELLAPLTVLGAASASATLALARMSEDRDLLDASEDVADVGLSEGAAQELLGSGGRSALEGHRRRRDASPRTRVRHTDRMVT